MGLRALVPGITLGWLLFSTTAMAQGAPQQPSVIEVLGLRSWTLKMVEDSVAKYQPGITLADHACAVILRDSVGFANAAAVTLSSQGTRWTILTVLEPDLAGRVRFPAYAERQPERPEWNDVFQALGRDRAAIEPLQHPEVLVAGADSMWGEPLPSSTVDLRAILRKHTSSRDWELARTAILSDSTINNRLAAALVLSNFGERDSTYYLLSDGTRANDNGGGTARMILSALSRGAPRRVNWAPARSVLEDLLAGTNLFAYGDVLDALVATEIEPALGIELAAINPQLLLDNVGARNPMTPLPAERFLVHISGQSLGRDAAAWRRWMDSPK